jgi:hypothetical protein
VFRVQVDWMCRGFWERLIGRHCGIPRQTGDHSFGDHLIHWVSQCYAINCYRSVVLFCVFMACVGYNLKQRVLIYDCYVKENSYKSCRRKILLKFHDTTCLSGDTTSKLVNKVRTHGILTDRKMSKINCVLTEENLMTSVIDLEILLKNLWGD